MIWQRLAESLRRRDWGTVLLEILIVVVGIFVGLQVDDWNQLRQDRRDERVFLAQLHSDVVLAEELSERVRERRLENLDYMLRAADVLYGRIDREELTLDECRSVGSVTALNIVVANLPSFQELIGTGRLHILHHDDLRSALLMFEQARISLNSLILRQTISVPDVNQRHPQLLSRESYFDVADDEVRGMYSCDTAGMRASVEFLNDFSIGIDIYDAYVRDGLAPWSRQLQRVHDLVDEILGERHTSGASGN